MMFYHADNFNPYDQMLSYSDTNVNELLSLIASISKYTQEHHGNTPTLPYFLDQIPSINLLTHSIEPYILPIWHKLTTPVLYQAERTDAQFSTHIRLLVGP